MHIGISPATARRVLVLALIFAVAAPLAAASHSERIYLRTRVNLNFVVDGDRDAPPIIFLHGYTDSSHSWSVVASHLADDYRTYALDQRGHGRSDKWRYGGYSISQYADDVIAFMDKRRIEQAVLVGHSMGSIIAHRVAALHPDRVNRLVLVGSVTTGARHDVVQYLWDEVIGPPTFTDPVDPDFIRDWQTGPNPVDPVFFEKVLSETAKVPARIWKSALIGMLTEDHSAWLDQISAPTLIIWGTADGFFSETDQDELRAAIPTATFETYEGAGHNTHWEQPLRVANDIRAFIEDQEE